MTPQQSTAARPAPAWRKVLVWLMLTASLVAAFGYNFREMWRRWFPAWRLTDLSLYERFVNGESYYTHGPLVPLVSLLIAILLIRHTRIDPKPCPKLGWPVLGAGVLLHLVASLARVNFASGFALPIVLSGLVLLLWGRQAFRRLWFPIALLVFMVPLPEVSIATLNFRLKMWAADWGVRLASGMGVAVARDASQPNKVILDGDKEMIVANVCNGLRTLISLVAFGALYAYVCRLRGFWRIGLFLMSVPVAVVSNSLRIVSLIFVADIWDVEAATGFFHDFSGLMIFAIAFALMFGLERLILTARKLLGKPARERPLLGEAARDEDEPSPWPAMAAAPAGLRGIASVATLSIAAALSLWLVQTVPNPTTAEAVASAVPAKVHLGGRLHRSYRFELDRNTLVVLEWPEYVSRRYVAPGEPPVDFILIFSKDNRKGTHPPDLCLEGGGDQIIARANVELPVEHREDLPCRELIVQGARGRTYYLYAYRCGDEYTRSFFMQQLTIFVNGLLRRDASGALVEVATPVTTDLEDARRRARELMATMAPHLDRNLP
jgi:EpsI family protein